MKKAMISQPIHNKSHDEIETSRENAKNFLMSNGYEFINTKIDDEYYNEDNMKKRGVKQIPLCYFAKSIENMTLCDACYFCKGWENSRGCKLEHDVAKAYNLEIIYEK